jgi:predicted permease
MWQEAAKVAITAIVVVAVAELAKRGTVVAALLASLPLTSLLAFVWLHIDTHDAQRIAALSHGIFWLVLPSLLLFVALPQLLKAGWSFWPSLIASCLLTALGYAGVVWALARFGVKP